ncbi:MAG: TauD/TfdA family dioxygenase [Pseudomonadota bacterium]|nr:TauD/TfdA family dioxygenase [Pseudomonadota bacterium]
MKIKTNRLGVTLGAEIFGINLNMLDEQTFSTINLAYLEHQVICIRNQDLDPDSMVQFSERFGDVLPHDNLKFTLDSHPKILVLSNDLDRNGNQVGVIDAGDAWHTDHQFKTHPANCTILYSLKNPPRGGATDFSNQYAAYDALSDETKKIIEPLRGLHSISKLKNKRVKISGMREDAVAFYKHQEQTISDVEHPLVRVHPVTGRKSLFCSPRFTVGIQGISEENGDALLDKLIRHSVKKEFRYRHHWQDGDVLMWDNRCVNHRATGGYEYPDIRHLYRTTVEGEATH